MSMLGGFVPVFWHWWALAVVLVVGEILLPATFFLFLSVGAAVTGLVLLIVPSMSLEIQLLIFAVGSGAALAGLRPFLAARTHARGLHKLNNRAASLVGQILVLDEPIVAGRGRVRVGDGSWSVHGPDMAAGFKVRVVSVDGATLKVEPAP